MDRHLQHKLEEFSTPPPPGAWAKIADTLDADSGYAGRLLQYEAQPPAPVWQHIEATLNNEHTPAKIVPFRTRFRRPMRYAAVACLLAAVLVTVTLTVKRTEAGAIEAGSQTTVPSREQAISNTSALPKENSRSPVVVPAGTDRNGGTPLSPPAEKESSTASVPALSDVGAAPAFAANDDYVVFSDGDGRTRKVSKKLAGMVNCKDDDLPCKQQLQQLRQKMAASIMTTDFAGLVESLRKLQ